MEITPSPTSENATELIIKKSITGVFPVRYQERIDGKFLTVIKVFFRDGKVYRYFELDAQKVENQSTWNDGSKGAFDQALSDINSWLISQQYIIATGGTITRDGDYLVHTFNGSDNFVVTQIGATYNTVEYLMVGGGGGGGKWGGYGGGGGAGGYLAAVGLSVSVQSYAVIIGAGGAHGLSSGSGFNGSDTTFNGLTALGGGGGGGGGYTVNGANGGSGGGGTSGGIGGTGSQGHNGGIGDPTVNLGGGGGGGAGVVGGAAFYSAPSGHGGNGGDGLSNSITGTGTFYGGGGGGGGDFAGGFAGVGGNGGGGYGGGGGVGSTDGIVNTGGGGGGNTGGNFGAGGSGIVVIRYYHPL